MLNEVPEKSETKDESALGLDESHLPCEITLLCVLGDLNRLRIRTRLPILDRSNQKPTLILRNGGHCAGLSKVLTEFSSVYFVPFYRLAWAQHFY